MTPFWPKFEVRTINDADLRRAARELYERASGFQPTVILGIRSGGYKVAQLMAEAASGIPLFPITCRRPSTQKKQKSSVIKNLLRQLPPAINDRLRIIEHILLTQFRAPRGDRTISDAAELAAIKTALAENSAAKILIVDDSVDTGLTLAEVVEAVRLIAGPDAAIKTAAITLTTTHHFIKPDFFLYQYVLCRFPWSLDFKN